jgi:hypothetical protein
MLDLRNVVVAKVSEGEAEKLLSNIPTLNRALVDRKTTLSLVRLLIKMEADGRHRMTTLQRLVARYNVLEAKQNEMDLMAYVAGKGK